MKKIEVFSMPFDDKSNKYFSLWRAAMLAHADQITIRDVSHNDLPGFLFTRDWDKEGGRILCIHWSTVLYGSRYLLKSISLLCVNALTLATLKIFFRFKIIWVMHNNYAHDYPHPYVDRWGRALLWHAADAVVAQQATTRQRLTAQYPDKRIIYAPHGHYIGAYGPRVTDRSVARGKHGFADDSIVLLCLGSIRPYKRIDAIAQAFMSARDSLDPRMRFLIAGKGDPGYAASLAGIAQDDRIRIENAFVPDELIPEYLACADYSVFFYDDSELTSGGIILSLSYGVPVIARSIASAEIIGKHGFVFDDIKELTRILQRLPQLPRPDSEEIIHDIASYSWDESAKMLTELYTHLVQV